MARSQIFRETRIECQRQKAGRRRDPMATHDDRAVMQWRRRIEDRDEQIVTEFGFELDAAVSHVLESDAALDDDQRARLRRSECSSGEHDFVIDALAKLS